MKKNEIILFEAKDRKSECRKICISHLSRINWNDGMRYMCKICTDGNGLGIRKERTHDYAKDIYAGRDEMLFGWKNLPEEYDIGRPHLPNMGVYDMLPLEWRYVALREGEKSHTQGDALW